jgi:thiamine-phosphate pyrophosphorylase
MPSPLQHLRLLDAAANRAREALRVMEDIARFILDDADLSATLKHIRHDLAGALDAAADPGALLAHRDTPGDVGTSIATAAEYRRTNLADVAAAACKRLTEALRSIEECAKIGYRVSGVGYRVEDAEPASALVEQLRYRAYDAERRLLQALGTGRARQWTLSVLLTESLCEHMPWEEVASQSIEGGADCLQLREKTLSDAELLRRAHRLVAIARGSNPGVAVFINDRPDIALLSGADGVHVGQDDLPLAEIRKLVGFTLLVGVSTTNMEQALAAARAGADVCGVGPMFPTATKHKPHLAGPGYLREYLATPATTRVPHLAIGGISPENIAELARAGCRGVAVSAAVCKRQRPAVACRALCDGLAPTH